MKQCQYSLWMEYCEKYDVFKIISPKLANLGKACPWHKKAKPPINE